MTCVADGKSDAYSLTTACRIPGDDLAPSGLGWGTEDHTTSVRANDALAWVADGKWDAYSLALHVEYLG